MADDWSLLQEYVKNDSKQAMDTLVLQMPDPAITPERPAVLAPGPTPAATLAAYYWALITGDEKAAIACTDNPTPAQQKSIGAHARMIAAGEKIRAAFKGKISPTDSGKVVVTVGLDTGINQIILDQIPITIADDKIQVETLDHAHPIDLKKIAGVWKVESTFPETAGDTDNTESMSEQIVSLCEQFIAKVKAGKFTTPAQLKPAVLSLRAEINSARQPAAASTQP